MKYHLLLLLFLLGILQIEAKSKTNDHLKDIGKRFLEIKAINRQILRWRFASRTPEETQEAKNMSAQLIANYILMQSSLENDEYSESAYVIYSLMTSDFQGGICGDEMDLNYYKFTKYWNQQRSRYHKNDFEHLTWRMIGPNDDLLYMTFLVSFKTHNIWGYSANPSYLVQTELRGDNEFSNYSITAIKEVGACTEKGTVQLNETDIVLSLYQRDPERVLTSQWIKKHVEWLFLNKIEGPVITSGWMSKTAPVGFEGTTCRQTGILNDEGIPEQYPNPQNIKTMFSWWKKFQIMYHIATDEAEPIKIQLLGDENENYVYRLTMKVQMGTRTEMPVKTFEFKIKMSKNEKNYWSINKFEVMCPPNPDITLKQQHLENYNQILIKKIKQMNETGDSWYLGTDVLKELFHPTHAEFTKCNITQKEKVASLESLQQSFFDERFSYKHIYEMAPDSVNEYGHLEDEYESVYWDIEMSFDSPNERSWALVKWRFTMEWSDDIQFYEVTKLDIGCARLKAKENFSYSGVRGII